MASDINKLDVVMFSIFLYKTKYHFLAKGN